MVVERLAKTLMSPLFSVTKTRPSGEKRTAVGWVSPENTMDSENPAGKVAAWTVLVIELRRQALAVQAMSNEEIHLWIIGISDTSAFAKRSGRPAEARQPECLRRADGKE
jgi:hypothetical protein